MYLVDTNVWLEHLLSQARAEEAKAFLTGCDSSRLSISDFSLHSICVILTRSRRLAELEQFITDLFIRGEVLVPGVPPSDTNRVTAAMQSQGLDFDDAYQYVIAKRDGLRLVSFDGDFDHTDLRRQTPAQALAALAPAERPTMPPGAT